MSDVFLVMSFSPNLPGLIQTDCNHELKQMYKCRKHVEIYSRKSAVLEVYYIQKHRRTLCCKVTYSYSARWKLSLCCKCRTTQ